VIGLSGNLAGSSAAPFPGKMNIRKITEQDKNFFMLSPPFLLRGIMGF
jgi:hypothetical protein